MEEKNDENFESSHFEPSRDKPHEWCLEQMERLDFFCPEADREEFNERLLNLFSGNLNHSAWCWTSMDSDPPTLIGVMDLVNPKAWI